MAQNTLMFYINAIHEGGAERVILQLAGRFADEGNRCILVTSFCDRNEYTVPSNVKRISMEPENLQQSRIKRNISRIRKLRRLIKEYRPDALISFMAEANIRALIASFALPVKTIVSVRNDPEIEYRGKLGRAAGKYLLPTADGCVFQTGQAKAWFPERLQRKSKIIMNQVSPAFFDIQRCGAGKNIVAAGRLNVQKNHALLISAFARIADETDENLLIYGIGELENELRELIEKLGLENRVMLMGLSTDMANDIKGARLFVLSSDYEGMPNALLEAMALGLPCISTDCPCGGPAAIINSGENGLLVPPGDEEKLAQAMLFMLKNVEEAERMGAAAKASAEDFRPEKVFSDWRDYIGAVIG